MRSRRQHLVTIAQTAKSIRLEEFHTGGEPVLTKHELNASQRAEFVRQLWSLPTKGSPLSYLKCFIPHHRIVAQSSDGSEFVWTVCFDCAQITHTGTVDYEKYGLRKNEYDSLRNFFVENGVPVRTISEYGELSEAYWKTLSH
jgi:hypothetical protein